MEWISTKDKLPSDGDSVIYWIRLKRDISVNAGYAGFYWDNNLGKGFGNDPLHCWDNKKEITHWMPLPEPPKQ